MKTPHVWRHCCVECRYEPGRGEDAPITIRYMDSRDDFEIVAGTLASAFRLLEARGWQLAAVTREYEEAERRSVRLVNRNVQVDRYYFKRANQEMKLEDVEG
jgi:hypothetical protein